jgi:hypothetical protein
MTIMTTWPARWNDWPSRLVLACARLLTCVTVALTTLWGSQALAQGTGVGIDVEVISGRSIDGDNIHSAKFVCGLQNQPGPGGPMPSSFVAARYRTAINIHNPHSRLVHFTVKGVRTQSSLPSSSGSFIGNPVSESLAPDGGLEFSCEDILSFIGEMDLDVFGGVLFTGFIVVRTARSDDLDVVAVYTAEVVGGGGGT